jgi:broad specificity phosphatase PhoE
MRSTDGVFGHDVHRSRATWRDRLEPARPVAGVIRYPAQPHWASAGARGTDRNWDLLVSSPLSRASETADIIGEHIGLTRSATYDDLAERHFGEAEGMTDWEAYHEWPHGWYPGLEPRSSVAERGLRTLSALATDNPDSAIIVVTHGGVIRAIIDVVHTMRSPRILNAAVSTLSIDDDGWLVHSINGVDV